MVNQLLRWQKTTRDDDILAALERCPLTTDDILRLSRTWNQPFHSLRRVQERLKQLSAVRQVSSWRYATTGPGGAAPLYYKLTLEGYRTLHADLDARPPTKRYFSQTGPGRHRHQQLLARFIVQTHVAAHARGLPIIDFHPENTLRIDAGARPLFPDCSFTLVVPEIAQLTFRVELDNSTESIWSQRDKDSIENKLRRYLFDLATSPRPYRVLFVVTGARQRLQHIVEAAGRLTPVSGFQPFCAVRLDDYLAHDDAFVRPCFSTPDNSRIALLRSQTRHLRDAATPLTPVAA
jgi:hypothetical protein